MEIRILMIDDDTTICDQVKELFDGENIKGNQIRLEYTNNFDDGVKILKEKSFDLVILDLFRGKPVESNEDKPGEIILQNIKNSCFIPVVFFSGLVTPIEHLQSDVVRIVRKSDGINELKKEIERVFDSQLPFIKQKLDNFIQESTRSYFWDFVHPNWKMLSKIKDEISLGYLLVRRLSNSFSKEQIIKLLGDPRISSEKVHPMEFYVYPPVNNIEFESGDILKSKEIFYIILTPSCDLVLRKNKRKAKKILLAKCISLKETKEYKSFKENSSNPNKGDLKKLIEGRKSDRFFFLPASPFIQNSILDFQNIIVIEEGELSKYTKVAKLDTPFAESMLSNFIRYYNRIGFPDIDSDYILDNLD